MHFDDRLDTVLHHPVTGERAAKTQFRQLLDLLGSKQSERNPGLLAAAWMRLTELDATIPVAERAEMISAPGMRYTNPELVVHLARDVPEIAAAAVASAYLSEEDWQTLIPLLPIRARGFLRFRNDLGPNISQMLERLGVQDRGLPAPASGISLIKEPAAHADAARPTARPAARPVQELQSEPKNAAPDNGNMPASSIRTVPETPVTPDSHGRESHGRQDDGTITALVQRIERFRKANSNTASASSDPNLSADEDVESVISGASQEFAFTSNRSGQIDWAVPELAPSLIGMSINQETVQMAIRLHQPLRKERIDLTGAPAISGAWVVNACPRFSQTDGQFCGYVGKFTRPDQTADAETQGENSSEADRLRQLLHELRTPVNAIQGFSEVIQQQLFGPVPHEYRALAAGIAIDSVRMLAGFEELDRLAQLETGALDFETGQCDFGAIISGQIAQLQEVLKSKNAELRWRNQDGPYVSVASSDAEALSWRILTTLAASLDTDEHIHIELVKHAGSLRLCCALPAALSDKADIFATTTEIADGTGMFGAGFALRLARAEARAAKGDLAVVDHWLITSLPLLTDYSSAPNQKITSGVS